jgi:uracil-DNA glycosylase family 4
MSRSDQLRDHLAFFKELGVTGMSRDTAWRVRPADQLPSGDPGLHEMLPEAIRREAISMVDRAGAPAAASAKERLIVIREDLGDCTRCKLHARRTHLVFGVGNPAADLMFVGEAPGRDEDLRGEPFVGRAGKLLTKIIESIDLRREDVYIANVIKCRPPDNRNPESEEIATCEPFLFAQIDAINPKVIVGLGSFAVRTLLGVEVAISKVRGQVQDYRGAKFIPTFHPAYLLRSPDKKREVWEDMKRVRDILNDKTVVTR